MRARGHRGPGSGPGRGIRHPAPQVPGTRELRLHPLIPRLVDPDALERMGAKRMGEGAGDEMRGTSGDDPAPGDETTPTGGER